ncbi:hypothetical protein AM10699_47280 [Acaryochloris marina MBIC10699]|nr:hypothetical protein AM10699_47280 [Acaryochloris marina MBIC10699]
MPMLKGVVLTDYLASHVWLTNTCVRVIRSVSHKAQMIHHGEVQVVSTDVMNADELWSFVKKSKSTVNMGILIVFAEYI